MELRSGLRLLRDQWILILCVTIVAVTISGVFTWRQTPQYASKVTFFISSSADSGDAASAYQGILLSQQRVKSYAELLRTERVMKGVVGKLSLDFTSQQLSDKVSTSVVPDTALLNATVVDPDPETAQRIAQTVGDEFVALVPRLENTSKSRRPAVKVSVVNSPGLPTSPVSPVPIRNLLVAAALGMLAGFALAVARRSLDTTIKTAEQLGKIAGVPTLGNVSTDRRMSKAPLIVHAPYGARAEEIRKIRTNLRFVDIDKAHKAILVTSAVAAEGKTSIACNLAISLAEAGKRVIFVDADLRQPRSARYLGLPNGAGLTDVLVGAVPFSAATQVWGKQLLTVLTSGSTPPNPSELLGSQQMRELLAELRQSYDVIIVDGPPLLPVADAVATASLCDGALMVVRRASTRQEQLRDALELLRNAEVLVLGTVLNFGSAPSGQPYEYGNLKQVQRRRQKVETH